MPVDPLDYATACRWILTPVKSGRMVCVANVHMAMECHDDADFAATVAAADLVVPDGMPLVWMLRRTGWPDQTRVYGPTLMQELCTAAAPAGVPIALYGGQTSDLATLQQRLPTCHPGLHLSFCKAPPFRPLEPAEEAADCAAICASGARILFVGLGCPKQEQWMARNREHLPGIVAIGVGAAFAFHAGRVRQAPAWLQRLGLEWLYRLAVEPRRLWRRYVYHNPRFIVAALRQLWRARRAPRSTA